MISMPGTTLNQWEMLPFPKMNQIGATKLGMLMNAEVRLYMINCLTEGIKQSIHKVVNYD
jgi:hypothetical protein